MIEVVTSQMITYGFVGLLQVLPMVFVGIYVFDVSTCLHFADGFYAVCVTG